ncbi:hypothetical protein UA08_03620 [Talaromyces atroroseus]|uniref:AAA+ ATPase domain-containing protein n=1 Tax=Talaromyces atroroseus TaxID=1441469 RepID=A0A225ARE6_TALAT|nr:hypothetical protein UA08_03620 [Talaromyces atroroseus]OKL60944.1 hypothetical protein UA08_03620 [Talaromyces atroroseus]
MAEQEKPTPDAPARTSIQRVMTDSSNKTQRLLRVDQIYSRKERQIHFVKTAKSSSKPDRFSKTAMVVRRIISKQGIVSHTEIDIRSPPLQQVFRELYKGVDGLELNKTPPVVCIPSPFFFFWQDLWMGWLTTLSFKAKPELIFWAAESLLRIKEEEKSKSQPNKQLIDDIGTALRFVEEDYSGQIASLESLIKENQITWDLLWAIFPPKTPSISPKYGVMNIEQAFRLQESGYEQRPNGSWYFSAVGQIVQFDGQDFGKGTISLEIDKYDGSRQIRSLSFYPLVYHPDEDATRERLMARGRKYLSLLDQPACRDYPVTYAVKEIIQPDGKFKSEMFNAKGRVMADPEGYYLHNSSSALNTPWIYSEDILSRTSLSDQDLLICASWVNGFSFEHKTWCQLDVTPLQEIEWNGDAFKSLVMEENRRQLIHGLVKAHRHSETGFDDIVENKGKGLIALLTGSPGVGKTLTAEAVAEVTQRPLYVVATGELGVDADTVDRRLEKILDITRRWGCVLLIDEADVFLATRGKDLNRDALVSIFLRRLEYFRGVAILTTNRKSEIDDAFKSRIHFTIHYPDLDADSRRKVWKNFLTKVAKTSELSEVTEDDFATLSKHALNGRQIKNIVSCAVSLSREQKKQVSVKDIEGLMKILLD